MGGWERRSSWGNEGGNERESREIQRVRGGKSGREKGRKLIQPSGQKGAMRERERERRKE